MPASLTHVIWDWNGTLLDDCPLCVQAMNAMLARRALPPVGYDFYRCVVEFPVRHYYHNLGYDLLGEPFERISGEFIAYYQARWRDCPLQSGVPGILAQLRARGVGQSVLSASREEYLLEQLRHYAVDAYLDGVTGVQDHHGHGKLHRARAHMRRLNLDPATTLLVGDTLHDAEVARAAGCRCVLTACGHMNARRLRQAGVPVIGSPGELVAII